MDAAALQLVLLGAFGVIMGSFGFIMLMTTYRLVNRIKGYTATLRIVAAIDPVDSAAGKIAAAVQMARYSLLINGDDWDADVSFAGTAYEQKYGRQGVNDPGVYDGPGMADDGVPTTGQDVPQ